MVGMQKIIVIESMQVKKKTNENPVTITTWQSIYKLKRPFFKDFEVVIGDEAHLFKSKSLISIMTKMDAAIDLDLLEL